MQFFIVRYLLLVAISGVREFNGSMVGLERLLSQISLNTGMLAPANVKISVVSLSNSVCPGGRGRI